MALDFLTILTNSTLILRKQLKGDTMKHVLTVLLALSMTITILSAQITTFPFTEGFEETIFPPSGWVLIDDDGDGYNWFRASSSAYPTNSGTGAAMSESYMLPEVFLTPDNYLISPQIVLPENIATLQWYVRTMMSWASAETYSVMISTTTPTVDAFFEIFEETLMSANASWTERQLSLSAFANQSIYIAFRHHTAESAYAMFLDDITVFIPHSYDLEALALTGSQTPTVGISSDYKIQIKNVGSLIATGYTVSLRSDTSILSSTSGTAIQPNDIVEIILSWTPDQQGAMMVYGEIDWHLDTNLENNQTSPLTVDVMSEGLVNVYIGNLNSTSYIGEIPFNFGMNDGVSQIIYLEEEINTTGLITHLTYTFNGFGNITQELPVKIYLGTTNIDSFANNNSWVPYNSFTLVYDGFLPVNTSGIQDMMIQLDQPYQYNGGNLVVMNHRIYTSYWKSANRWKITTTPEQNRALYVQSTSQSYNIEQGLPSGTRLTQIANIGIMISAGTLGKLQGVVYNETTGLPLNDVIVSIDDTLFSDITNISGEYSISYIPTGLYTITAKKQGFLDSIINNYEIYGHDNNILDINMQLTPLVSLSGTILASDTMLGLSNALIMLTGYEEYSTTTDSNGEFSISDIYIDNLYTFTVTRQGYLKYVNQIDVIGGNNIILEPIILSERLVSPSNIIISDFQTHIDMSWNAPMVGYESFSHSQNNLNTGVGTNSPATFTIVHRYTQEQLLNYGVSGAYLNKIAFVPMREATYSIIIYTGGSSNPLLPGIIVYEQDIDSSLLAYSQWNEIDLLSDIRIPVDRELWIGIHIITAHGLPAGVDIGPQLHGYGDVLFYQGLWSYMQSLNTMTPLPFNWLIKAFADGINVPDRNTRKLTGYNIYRALESELQNETLWISLVQNHSETIYNDFTWSSVPENEYRYVVKSVYNNNLESPPIFSSIAAPNMMSRVSINLITDNESVLQDATVKLVNNNVNEPHIYQTRTTDNTAYFPLVWKGTYTLTINHNSFLPYTNTNLIIDTNPFTYDANFLVLNVMLNEGFENDIFPPPGWNSIDADGDGWNWSREDFSPAFGQYFVISQSAYNTGYGIWLPLSPDNYLISSPITLLNEAIVELSFYVRSDPGVPTETYSVMISEYDPIIEFFVPIHTETLSNATSYWSRRNINLSDYHGKTIYIAWRHFDSYDFNLIGLDGILVNSSGGYEIVYDFPPPTDLTAVIEDENNVLLNWIAPDVDDDTLNKLNGYRVYRNQSLISDIIHATTYTDTDLSSGDYVFSVVAVYAFGVSEAVSIEINIPTKISDGDNLPPLVTALIGNIPNPANPNTTLFFNVANDTVVNLTIYNIRGQLIRTLINDSYIAGRYRVDWNGRDDNNRNVSSGVYFYMMETHDYRNIRKLTILK